MEAVISTVTPLFVTAAVAAGVVYATGGQLCGEKKKGGVDKKTTAGKTQNAPQKDEQATEEDIDINFPEKKKKQAKVTQKLILPKASTMLKVKQPQPKKEVTAPVVEAKKEVKKAEPVAEKKKAPKKEEAPKELTEVEKLRLRILELEKAATEKDQPKTAAKKDAKKAAKEEEHNPQPNLTEKQKAEQQKLLEQYERDNSWTEVKEQKRQKSKKQTIELLDLNNTTTIETITVTQADRFVLVGEKGQKLNEIISQSKCKIELSHRPPKPLDAPQKEPMTIDIQGTKDDIKIAKRIIFDLIQKGYSSDLSPDTVEWKCSISGSDISKVMGAKGANIKSLKEKLNVQVHVPPKPEKTEEEKAAAAQLPKGKKIKKSDDESKVIIRVVGEATQVDEAKEAIRSLVQFGFSAITHPGYEVISPDFPIEYRKYLLISYGNQDVPLIHKIGDLSSSKLIFPQKDDRSIIHIVGTSDNVYKAASLIKQVLQKLQQPVADVYLPGFESNDFSKNDQLW